MRTRTKDFNDIVRESNDNHATKITSPDAGTTYIGIAQIGTSQSTAAWQCKKIVTSGNDTTITWADGNDDFDNVATDLTLLTYI